MNKQYVGQLQWNADQGDFCLVTVYPSGEVEVAFKPTRVSTWSPPTRLEEAF